MQVLPITGNFMMVKQSNLKNFIPTKQNKSLNKTLQNGQRANLNMQTFLQTMKKIMQRGRPMQRASIYN